MVRDTIQLGEAVSTISEEYLLEFTSEYELEHSILLDRREDIPNLHGMAHKRSKGWNATSRLLFRGGCNNIEHTPYPYPKTTRSPIMPSRAESKLLTEGRHMDLFNLISAPNPTKVKTRTRPRAAYEVPLLTTIASRVIDMEDTAVELGSSRTPPALEKSLLNFSDEDSPQRITNTGTQKIKDGSSHEIPPTENVTTAEVVREPGLEKEVAALGPPVNKRNNKRGNNKVEANAPPKVLRHDHAAFRPDAPTAEKSVSYPDSLSYVRPQPHPEQDIAQSSRKTATKVPTRSVAVAEVQGLFSAKSLESGKSTSLPSVDGSPEHIYQPGKEEIEKLDQEIKSLKAVEAEVNGLQNQTKNLETLLEAKVDMKKVAKAKNTELAKELESLRV
ncbi:hypothetical protein Tco_0418413 [Tanacetum coccineum]